jgi:hypothetical protein
MVTTLLSCVLGVRQFFSLLAFIAREEIAQFVDSGMQGWRRATRLLPSNRLPVRLQLLFYQMPWSNHQAWLTIIFEFLGNRSRQYADCSTTSNLDVRAIPRYGESMNLNVQIPDDLARSLNAAGGISLATLSRRSLWKSTEADGSLCGSCARRWGSLPDTSSTGS